MPTRRAHKPSSGIVDKLGEVDWLRWMQRAAVFLRDMRGDDPRDIQDDHVSELERSQQLRAAAKTVTRRPRRSPHH